MKHMNNIRKDRKLLESIVEKYGSEDTINYVRYINEGEDEDYEYCQQFYPEIFEYIVNNYTDSYGEPMFWEAYRVASSGDERSPLDYDFVDRCWDLLSDWCYDNDQDEDLFREYADIEEILDAGDWDLVHK